MRTETETPQDRTAGLIPSSPWRVASCVPLPGFRLRVTFMDGSAGYVDLSRRVASPHAGIFSVLKDETLFSQVYVDYGVVTWPGEIDLAPDTMYDAIQQQGEWILGL